MFFNLQGCLCFVIVNNYDRNSNTQLINYESFLQIFQIYSNVFPVVAYTKSVIHMYSQQKASSGAAHSLLYLVLRFTLNNNKSCP